MMDLELSNVSDITEEPVSQDTLLEFQLDEEFEGLDNFVSRYDVCSILLHTVVLLIKLKSMYFSACI